MVENERKDGVSGKADFPKRWKCECGSELTVIGKAIAPLKASGSVPITAFGSMEKKVTSLLDPRTTKFVTPMLISYFDVCWDCGKFYCVKAEVIQVPKEAKVTARA